MMPSGGDAIARLTCGDRMKRALALVADGTPYRDAAREVGYRDHREVYRWATRAGPLDVHSEQLVAGYKRISALSNAELERRLIEPTEDIPTRDLAIIGGIAAEKAAKYEDWGKAPTRQLSRDRARDTIDLWPDRKRQMRSIFEYVNSPIGRLQ